MTRGRRKGGGRGGAGGEGPVGGRGCSRWVERRRAGAGAGAAASLAVEGCGAGGGACRGGGATQPPARCWRGPGGGGGGIGRLLHTQPGGGMEAQGTRAVLEGPGSSTAQCLGAPRAACHCGSRVQVHAQQELNPSNRSTVRTATNVGGLTTRNGASLARTKVKVRLPPPWPTFPCA